MVNKDEDDDEEEEVALFDMPNLNRFDILSIRGSSDDYLRGAGGQGPAVGLQQGHEGGLL